MFKIYISSFIGQELVFLLLFSCSMIRCFLKQEKEEFYCPNLSDRNPHQGKDIFFINTRTNVLKNSLTFSLRSSRKNIPLPSFFGALLSQLSSVKMGAIAVNLFQCFSSNINRYLQMLKNKIIRVSASQCFMRQN